MSLGLLVEQTKAGGGDFIFGLYWITQYRIRGHHPWYWLVRLIFILQSIKISVWGN